MSDPLFLFVIRFFFKLFLNLFESYEGYVIMS